MNFEVHVEFHFPKALWNFSIPIHVIEGLFTGGRVTLTVTPSDNLSQGALAGETKWRSFQFPCEMKRGIDLHEREKKARRGYSFGAWRHSATKRNGVRAHSGGFQQTPAHSNCNARIYGPFVSPLKLPGLNNTPSVTLEWISFVLTMN